MVKFVNCFCAFSLICFCPSTSSQTKFPVKQYYHGGCGSGSFIPTFHTNGEFPYIGNNKFQLLSRNLCGGVPGFVWFSCQKWGLFLNGLHLLINPYLGFGLPVFANGSIGAPGDGQAVLPLPIPLNAELVNSSLFLQAFYLSDLKTYHPLNSHGLKLTICPPVPSFHSALFNRTEYQKVITSSNLVHMLWSHYKPNGFAFIKAEKFCCGNQCHWLAVVKHINTGIEFCLIPGGSYRMGRLNFYFGANNNELPVHYVHVEPFLFGKKLITQKQWRFVMNTAPWDNQKHVYNGSGSGDYPANYVNGNEAIAFCKKLGGRLPTESEWEYCARAGTEFIWPYGNDPNNIGKYCWYYNNTVANNQDYPHLSEAKPPNAFGLYDTIGNLGEYCYTLSYSDYKCVYTNGSAIGMNSGDVAVRSSPWACAVDYTRVAFRANVPVNLPTLVCSHYGIRVVVPIVK